MAEKADWYIEKAQKLTLECAYLKQVLYEVGEKMELRLQSFIDAKNASLQSQLSSSSYFS